MSQTPLRTVVNMIGDTPERTVKPVEAAPPDLCCGYAVEVIVLTLVVLATIGFTLIGVWLVWGAR